MEIKEATGKHSRGHVYYVRRDPSHEWHAVQLVRACGQRRWLCECKDFFWHKFRVKRHCDHIRAARSYRTEQLLARDLARLNSLVGG
jgi:hypothetical protein